MRADPAWLLLLWEQRPEKVCVGSRGLVTLPETKLKEMCSGRAQMKMIRCWQGMAYAALLGEVTQN